jgi:hypothetical protein
MNNMLGYVKRPVVIAAKGLARMKKWWIMLR